MILFYELSSFLTMIKNLVNERSSLKQREASFPPPLSKNNGGKESSSINTSTFASVGYIFIKPFIKIKGRD